MAPEIWRVIPNLDYPYEVSTHGNVRRAACEVLIGGRNRHALKVWRQGQPIRLFLNSAGYLRAPLQKGKKSTAMLVHRLVANAFLGAPLDARMQVNHKDGCKTNNCVENLEWSTSSANQLHARVNGLNISTGAHSPLRGEFHPMAKLSRDQVAEIRALAGQVSNIELARRFGVSKSHISRIRHGKFFK